MDTYTVGRQFHKLTKFVVIKKQKKMWICVIIVYFLINSIGMCCVFLVFSPLVRQYVSGAGDSIPCTWVTLCLWHTICLPIRIVVFIKVQFLVLHLEAGPRATVICSLLTLACLPVWLLAFTFCYSCSIKKYFKIGDHCSSSRPSNVSWF